MSSGAARIARRRRIADRLASWVVASGGLLVIASILGILVFILLQVWPLAGGARVSFTPPVAYEGPPLLALAGDEYRERIAGIAADGSVSVLRTADGSLVERRPLLAAPAASGAQVDAAPQGIEADAPGMGARAQVIEAGAQPDGGVLSAALDDGRVLAIPIGWDLSYADGTRSITPRIGDPIGFALDPSGRPPRLHTISIEEDGAGLAAAVLADGSLAVARRATEENLLSGEVTATVTIERLALDREPSVLMIDHRQQALYAGTPAGEVLWWDLRSTGEAAPNAGSGAGPGPRTAPAGGAAITAMTLLIGGRSLVTGSADGALGVWFPVRDDGGELGLVRIRELPPQPGAIRRLAPSLRNKGFLAWSDDGTLGLYHSTSSRRLWSGSVPAPDGGALFFAPRADGALLAAGGRLVAAAIDNPHPETTLRTLFGKVWYEGYERPALVWQSSGGSDDFEPKLSLTPLLAGTLKGTFFSLLLAIPIGVLAAMYVSQLMHPTYLRWLKPMVEVMAALPTVVLGFLAGLWLAPKLERLLPGLAVAVLGLPLLVIAAAALWRRLPAPITGRLLPGTEVFFFVLVIAGGLALAVAGSVPLEAAVFGGDFGIWLERATGLRYDQRNAIVVGLAMGFAVIPIIFAISEDAFSNVPRNLVAGSLALGATRWQTVVRVVLPTASPGIFSAVMVGFGRAIGETMIVLMATGNTPILSFSPFNGFRTLSANIAVEIPEAPVGGTLYRTLFLASLVLFALTFLVNTAAELIRQRLRDRFSRL